MCFTGVAIPNTDSGQTYHIDPTATRFLMLRVATDNAAAPHVRVIFHWFDELKKLTAGK